jgi:predicted Ser/Thr protein kinase
MEVHPIYVLKAGNEISPVFESPLGLFDPSAWARCWRIATASRAGASPG